MNKIAAITGIAALVLGARAGWTQSSTSNFETERTSVETTETTTRTTGPEVKAGSPAFLQQWPEASRTIASSMIEKYGQPDEFTQGKLIWKDRAPFKRVAVYRFPTHHYDMLEQTVDYFYGSQFVQWASPAPMMQMGETTVVPNVDRFELSSISNSEDNNVLALNLANDVLHGRISPKQANQEYGDVTMRTLSGKTSAATERLSFTPSRPSNIEWDEVLEARQGSGG